MHGGPELLQWMCADAAVFEDAAEEGGILEKGQSGVKWTQLEPRIHHAGRISRTAAGKDIHSACMLFTSDLNIGMMHPALLQKLCRSMNARTCPAFPARTKVHVLSLIADAAINSFMKVELISKLQPQKAVHVVCLKACCTCD